MKAMKYSKDTSGYFVTGILLALSGSVFFSTKAIFVKLAYRETTVDAITLLALRMLFSLPFFVVSALASSAKDDNVKFTTKEWLSVAAVGCMGYYVSSLLDFLGLQYVSAGIERLILFVYPTLVLLISSLFLNVSIKPYQWAALLITYLGLLIAFWGELNWGAADANFYKGAMLIFACAITYALYIVGSGRIVHTVGPAKFNSYAMTFAAVAVLIHFFIASDGSLIGLPATVYLYGFSMAIIGTVIPSYLVTAGIKRIGSGNAAIVGSIGPVSTIIQAYFFLQEPILGLQVAGTVCILIGVLMIGRAPKPQAVKP